jgi:hypothetical protein
MPATLDDVAGLALAMPEVTEVDRRGSRTWVVAGKTFAWERPFSKADLRRFGDETPPSGDIVALRVSDLEDKEAVLASEPRGFFTIPHFEGFAAVLIHLRTVPVRSLRSAVADAWLACAPPRLADEHLAETAGKAPSRRRPGAVTPPDTTKTGGSRRSSRA